MGYAQHVTGRPSFYRWGVAGLFLTLAIASATIAAGTSTTRMIAIYQRILRVRPDDAESFYELGDAYGGHGRETGDSAYVELAPQARRHAGKGGARHGPGHRPVAL